MPTKRVPFCGGIALVTYQEDWKPGDQRPTDGADYLAISAWAGVQHKAGLRQKQCGRCGGWWYPQELSTAIDTRTAYKDKRMTKPVTITSPVCNKCALSGERREG